uniref:HAT C-terminal dimerisation domain-containing protein n=1 Tax=Chenopodium quinoa TaxID=63459 RepID=A0A803LVH4_CHEQI
MSNTDNSSVPMDDESEVGNENATTKSTKVGDKRKSEYWNHFWDFRDPVTKKIVQVKCKYCEKMLTDLVWQEWLLLMNNHYDAIIASSSSKNNRNINVANVDNGSENLSSSNSEQMKKFYDDFDEEESDFIVEKSELDYYLEEARERRVEGEMFDILGWWKEKSDKYKVLSTLAKDILAIPISTVSSESAFSTSGRILDQFRSSLGPNMVEALVCTQDWLRASNVCIDIERFLEDVQKYEEELDGSDTGITQVNEFVGNN